MQTPLPGAAKLSREDVAVLERARTVSITPGPFGVWIDVTEADEDTADRLAVDGMLNCVFWSSLDRVMYHITPDGKAALLAYEESARAAKGGAA